MYTRASRTRLVAVLLVLLSMLLAACGTTTQPDSSAGGSASPTSAPAGAAATTAPQPSQPPAATAAPSPAEGATAAPAGQGGTLVLVTHDSFNISEQVVAEFEQQTGATVQILKSGDAGAALNKAILSKNNPLGDVFFGVDNTFFSRAIEADIFEAYAPQGLEAISEELRLDPQSRLVPIDYGYVNLNYARAAFAQGSPPVPQRLEDLTRPEYKGMLVVENPATSSPGLAFLLATVDYFGDEGDYTWREFWRDLRANEVLVVDGWEQAYYEHFSGASGSQGQHHLVVSYATSPAAEVYFSEGKLQEPPTGNILPPRGAFRQIEFAGILKGTRQPQLARQWMDFMLSKRFQEDIPLHMFVYPALASAAQPDVFVQFAQVPSQPAQLAPDTIAARREAWIQEWTRIVLR